MLLDIFAGSGSVSDTLCDSRHVRKLLSGYLSLDNGAVVTTAGGKMSWGRILDEGSIICVMKTTPENAPARVYFNCNDTLTDGFYVELSDGIVLSRIDGGTATMLESVSGLDTSKPVTIMLNRVDGVIDEVIACDGATTVQIGAIYSLGDYDFQDVMGVELAVDGSSVASTCILVKADKALS